MIPVSFQIATWTEDDLLGLPEAETDSYEYKSSRIVERDIYKSELKYKISKAASAFWNTGGGLFIAGVDDRGKVDGGLPARVGKQSLRDWVDQVLTTVTPPGPYAVRCIAPSRAGSDIQPGHVVLVIAFEESTDLPHMGPDSKYFVRAGAHSVPASHYLVEALRSRRGLRRPLLRGIVRMHEQKFNILELAVIAINRLPALNVRLTLDPLPRSFDDNMRQQFPLRIPVIDERNPFKMDIGHFHSASELFSQTAVRLALSFEDVSGREFHEQQSIELHRNIGPMFFPSQTSQNIERELRKISKQLRLFRELVQKLPADGLDKPGSAL